MHSASQAATIGYVFFYGELGLDRVNIVRRMWQNILEVQPSAASRVEVVVGGVRL